MRFIVIIGVILELGVIIVGAEGISKSRRRPILQEPEVVTSKDDSIWDKAVTFLGDVENEVEADIKKGVTNGINYMEGVGRSIIHASPSEFVGSLWNETKHEWDNAKLAATKLDSWIKSGLNATGAHAVAEALTNVETNVGHFVHEVASKASNWTTEEWKKLHTVAKSIGNWTQGQWTTITKIGQGARNWSSTEWSHLGDVAKKSAAWIKKEYKEIKTEAGKIVHFVEEEGTEVGGAVVTLWAGLKSAVSSTWVWLTQVFHIIMWGVAGIAGISVVGVFFYVRANLGEKKKSPETTQMLKMYHEYFAKLEKEDPEFNRKNLVFAIPPKAGEE